MCGIAGLFVHSGTRTSADVTARLRAMNARQVHRGPDDGGIYVLPNGRGGLANRRLAIRDISPAGHMPMANTDESLWITYNGEIYNADELRTELQGRGYVFRSHSDTEVILHGYHAWGGDVVQRLRGIFAFAVLDIRDGAAPVLFLARDRLGVKPLYYQATAETFSFASELGALCAGGTSAFDVDPAGLVGYLLLGSIPAPLTFFSGVNALPAAATLLVSLERAGSMPTPIRYWCFPRGTDRSTDPRTAPRKVRERLLEIVRGELVSDVPLGAFLSGGLDSSAVVALMRACTDGPIRTCSMVFEEAAYNEAPFARAMALAVGAEHHERTVTAGDVSSELDRFLGAMDQPTIDGLNTYFVSQTAREAGLTVSLSGLGGDELFGGYDNTFRGARQLMQGLALVHAVPAGTRVAGRTMDVLSKGPRWAKLRDAMNHPPSAAGAYLARRGLFSPSEVKALVREDIWCAAMERFDPTRYVEDGAGSTLDGGHFAWTSRAELAGYTQTQLLRDTDRMSMDHSLEVRVPFLDHVLVEEVLTLPVEAHRSGRGPKPLLLAAVGDLLPPAVRDRRGKLGFTFPLEVWMRGQLAGRMQVLQDNAAERPWLREKAVREIWTQYRDGRVHWSRAWAIAVLGNERITDARPLTGMTAPEQSAIR